jgi:fused signal recognition particle receptor
LLVADVGVQTTQFIVDELNRQIAEARIRDREGMLNHLRQMMAQLLDKNQKDWDYSAHSPCVILVIGVNGSGKTTTIGKLAQRWHNEGKKVLLAAGDTFRAAAMEQLQMWADRIGIPCIRQDSGADPSAVAFDGVQAAVARKMDIVIVDTAGRLQTNLNLMEELKKVKRVIGKVIPGAPHETLLVLDATIGQNSIAQAKQFHEAMDIDGLVMTKLDGTSKGGVLLNISQEMNLPVRFIGIGEKSEDLQEFHAADFVRALFED